MFINSLQINAYKNLNMDLLSVINAVIEKYFKHGIKHIINQHCNFNVTNNIPAEDSNPGTPNS